MKKFTSYINNKRGALDRNRSNDALSAPEGDSPEANMVRGVKAFCEAGNSNDGNQGEEVLHLPVIVEAAESSPAAATLAAQYIRKYLSTSNSSRPHMQYNAIMLIRILSENPGPSFTRNIDDKFVSTVKQVLRNSREARVQQILRETLSSLYREKTYDQYLSGLFAMWIKESGIRVPSNPQDSNGAPPSARAPGTNNIPSPPPFQAQGNQQHRSRCLPGPEELAARIEEAKTSAKLLQQLVQSTPQNELKGNDLISEFAERCQAAQRSIQGYINADNPSADDDTMQTLIETSEQLSLALSKHSRALLQARKALSASGASPTPPLSDASPPLPNVPGRHGLGLSNEQAYPPQGPYVLPEIPQTTQYPVNDGYIAYSPPPLGPQQSITRRNVPVPEPVGSGPVGQTYSPPPLPPTAKKSAAHAPQSTTIARPSSADDDPFSDRNAAHDDTAAPLPPSDAGLSHSGALASRPGYSQVTSSYVRRQDSSEVHHTMHGATQAQTGDSSPVSPELRSAERHQQSGRPSSEDVSPVLHRAADADRR